MELAIKTAFEYLEVDDTFACMRVCSTWSKGCDDELLWKKNCERDFPGWALSGSAKEDYKNFVERRKLIQENIAKSIEENEVCSYLNLNFHF
jgi:hypothetical protein